MVWDHTYVTEQTRMTWPGFRLLSIVIFALIRFLCLINRNKFTSTFYFLILASDTQIGESLSFLLFLKGRTAFFLDLLRPPNLQIAILPQHYSNDCLQHGPDQVPHGQTSLHSAAGEL